MLTKLNADFANKNNNNIKLYTLIELAIEHDLIMYVSNKTCQAYQWQCGNYQCINKVYLCDGRADCTDGSDESPRQCSKNGNKHKQKIE